MLFFQKNDTKILCNEKIDKTKVELAKTRILELQNELSAQMKDGFGPFLAAIYNKQGNLIAKCVNSVVFENCSINHAEVNAIKEAQKKLGTFDLSSYDLSLYVTSEPCIMCIGAIMWSGIKEVYFGVPSSKVEKITGFDEGFKPNWLKEFKKRGITVYGNIEPKVGCEVLKKYVNSGFKIYNPTR